ncbi:hypothetical protein [Streptomyces monashensis]|uniref:hypothetical protein n=1 Tax=Streptomyces monashensis TaxID=1678012 RepID=UPI0011606F38|nr:hypothetical protein [Streptomyces monashensis]
MSRQPHRRPRTARRTALAVGAVLALGGLACVPLLAQAGPGRSPRVLSVASDGSGTYRTVQATVDAASPKDTLLAWAPSATTQTRQYFRDDRISADVDSSQKYGFLIANSTVSSAAKPNTYYLGRPWRSSATSVAQSCSATRCCPPP